MRKGVIRNLVLMVFNTAGMPELGRRYAVRMLEVRGFSYDADKGPIPAK